MDPVATHSTHHTKANGHFASADTCVKLKCLYPSIEEVQATRVMTEKSGSL